MSSEQLFPPAGTDRSPFSVDSNEGREVVVGIDFAALECGEIQWGGLRLLSLDLRLSNDEAADLLVLLDAEIGEWTRTRSATQAAFLAGEGSLSAEARAEYGLKEDEDAYDPSDPKHPRYAENLREFADEQRKRLRESR
jgi:hypothetical protein